MLLGGLPSLDFSNVGQFVRTLFAFTCPIPNLAILAASSAPAETPGDFPWEVVALIGGVVVGGAVVFGLNKLFD